MKTQSFQIIVSESIGAVSAEVFEPANMSAFIVLAHGAGANMNHRFMKALSNALAEAGIGTLRYNFPYMEKGKGRPDPPAVAEKTTKAAVEKAYEMFPDTHLFAGGKSFGGRMTSQLVSKQPISYLKGLVFYGFPLHAPGKPSTDRAAHLRSVTIPMLFLQGTRDALADLTLITEVTTTLPTSTLVLLEGADHSFVSGKKDLIPRLAEETNAWVTKLF
jgi:predicted alpha/beta-hydrolase family hydrolase